MSRLEQPCLECAYKNPKNNPMVDKLQKMAYKKDNPPKISNKKMFVSNNKKDKKVPKGSHKMPDGSLMKDKDMKKKKKK
jgi:hypothetical protein